MTASVAEKVLKATKVKPVADNTPRESKVEFLASLAGVLVTGLFIITFVLQAFEIPSGSMENTLLVGDHLFVNRVQLAPPSRWIGPLLPYREIHRGDIVVFLSPEEKGLFIVKRIVGIPGDHIHLRDGQLYRNGEKLDEPYILHNRANYDPYRDNFPSIPADRMYGVTSDEWMETMPSFVRGGDVVVPPEHYFGMGDNRDNSKDSRYWGFIPRANVIGRPLFVYWSFQTPDDQYLMRETGDRIGFLAHTIVHFFDQTRWSRTLRIIK
jgi:signal peptidase I